MATDKFCGFFRPVQFLLISPCRAAAISSHEALGVRFIHTSNSSALHRADRWLENCLSMCERSLDGTPIYSPNMYQSVTSAVSSKKFSRQTLETGKSCRKEDILFALIKTIRGGLCTDCGHAFRRLRSNKTF